MRVCPLGPESRAGSSDGFVSCQLSQAGPTERERRLQSPQDHCRTRRGSKSQPFINPENGLPVRTCLHGVDRRGRPERAWASVLCAPHSPGIRFGKYLPNKSWGSSAREDGEEARAPTCPQALYRQPRTGQPGVAAQAERPVLPASRRLPTGRWGGGLCRSADFGAMAGSRTCLPPQRHLPPRP